MGGGKGALQPGVMELIVQLTEIVEPHAPLTGDALWAALSHSEIERVRKICAGVVAHEKLPVAVAHFKRLVEKADRILATKDLS